MPAHRLTTFVDLFCGAGGLSEGFRQAGWEPAAGSDIDPDAMATYRRNFPEATAIGGDLRESRVRSRLLDAASGVDIVAGGPPCQAFSQVQNHARIIDDPRNSLYREFVKIVTKAEPKAFVMENVPGLAQMGALEQILEDLACRGAYRVRAAVVDAADFGVPQSRKRIVFIGMHRSHDQAVPLPVGTAATDRLRLERESARRQYRVAWSPGPDDSPEWLSVLNDPWDESIVSTQQAIGDLAGLRPGNGRYDLEVLAGSLPAPSSAFQKAMRDNPNDAVANMGVPRINGDTRLRLSHIPPGGNYLDLPDEMRGRYLTEQRWGPHNGSSRLSRRHYYAYRRLHPEIWSWTLNTKADSVYHWAVPRALSVREFARLQSFPDRFVFTTDPRRGDLPGRIGGGPGHSCYRQVGNAVPPLLGKAIAEALRRVVDTPLAG